jgi:protoheme IX farnesyltransferase
MGVNTIDVESLLLLATGGYLLTGASNGLNQIIERRNDSIMSRTKNRPLPTGRMTLNQALILSISAGIIGIYCLGILSYLAAILGVVALGIYASIAWLAHEDYAKVGYKMLPFNSGLTGRSASLILLYTLFCIPTSLLPWALPNGNPMVGNLALVVAIIAGLGFSWFAWRLSITLDKSDARKLMFASFAYLPLVQIIYVLDKTSI